MSDLSKTSISGTIRRDDGSFYIGFIRFNRWRRSDTENIVGAFSPVTKHVAEDGYFEADLRPGYYRLEIGTDSPVAILVPQRTADESGTVFDLSAILVSATSGGGGDELYYGPSDNATLTEAQVLALFAVRTTSCQGSRRFEATSASTYKFFAWPDSFGSPRADDGFTDPRTGVAVSMAAAAEGFDEEENGWWYQLVSVGGVAYRVYRTRNKIGATLTINVTN